ncbi:MAG: T9SS type A sorting domain-containing protein, partial [Flavobacteriales bacterium]|nr:T9SS type A sorting domain-containing protein [Flavobacteriales bacterium]
IEVNPVPLEICVPNVGLGKEVALEFSLHPNPTNGPVILQLEQWEGVNVRLFDFSGRQVFARQILGQYTPFDLSNLAKGTYFLKVQSAQGQGVQRIVVLQ